MPLEFLSPANSPSTAISPPAVVVNHLNKSYSGRPVVRDLSFVVERGEIFALLGPNGAGKTTTIEILEGYREPDGGRVRVLGLDPRRQGDQLRRRIGLMLQSGGFYPTTTPVEAIHLYASFFDKPADPDTLLRLVGLDEAGRTRYRRLSGGQKQRLSLAVALVGQPELVFLDEPTAGMDPHARHVTWDIIRSLKSRGVTVILTTHLIDEAERLSDRVAIVDGGQLIALGSPGELTGGSALDEVRLTTSLAVGVEELSRLRWVTSARSERSGTVVLQTDSPFELLVELSGWLQARNVVPRTIQVGHESLEDVFLRLTGKELPE